MQVRCFMINAQFNDFNIQIKQSGMNKSNNNFVPDFKT